MVEYFKCPIITRVNFVTVGQTDIFMVVHVKIFMMGPIKAIAVHCNESYLHRNPRINVSLTSFVMVGYRQVLMVGHGEKNVFDV